MFFIRDGAHFPDLVHAAKASPLSNLDEGWRLADCLSFHPESMNTVTYLFDDYVGRSCHPLSPAKSLLHAASAHRLSLDGIELL